MEQRSIFGLANLFTLGNALAGVFAIFFAAKGDVDLALRLIALGMLLDSFDGPIARWLGPSSEGKTLDRVGDRISMALAPAVVFVVWASFHPASLVLGALFVVVSLVRLVRTDASGDDMVGVPFWAPGVIVIAGMIAGISFWPVWMLAAGAAALSMSRISFSLPWAVRKPNPASGHPRHLLLAFVRSLPLLALVVFPEPYYRFLGWGILIGSVSICVIGFAFGSAARRRGSPFSSSP